MLIVASYVNWSKKLGEIIRNKIKKKETPINKDFLKSSWSFLLFNTFCQISKG